MTETAHQLYDAPARLSRHIHRMEHRMAHEDLPWGRKLHRGQNRLLSLISQNNGASQGELGDKMDVRPSSMTEMLLKMEQAGLIVRKQDERPARHEGLPHGCGAKGGRAIRCRLWRSHDRDFQLPHGERANPDAHPYRKSQREHRGHGRAGRHVHHHGGHGRHWFHGHHRMHHMLFHSECHDPCCDRF